MAKLPPLDEQELDEESISRQAIQTFKLYFGIGLLLTIQTGFNATMISPSIDTSTTMGQMRETN
jgi:hypothetical protein